MCINFVEESVAFTSSTLLLPKESAFFSTMTSQGSPKKRRTSDIATSGQAIGRPSSSRLTQSFSFGINPSRTGDSEDNEDHKKPVNYAQDSDASSDDSEKRRRRRMIARGKRAQGTSIPSSGTTLVSGGGRRMFVPRVPTSPANGVRSEDGTHSPKQDSRNAGSCWFLDVPSPFAANEIVGKTLPKFTPTSGELPTSSCNNSARDNVPTKRSRAGAKGRSKKSAANLQMSNNESKRPRRRSIADSFLTEGHPRAGTRFPNMAIEGLGRACGMPTTAQLHTMAGKRYTFLDDNSGQTGIMTPLPLPTKVSERWKLMPRDFWFKGPPRKNRLLVDAESSRDTAKEPSLDKSKVTCVTATEGSPPRGRAVIVLQPSNAAREESEERPGWRKTALVQAHVITGEYTRHTPWVADVRPLELERCGFTKESGYGTFPELTGNIADHLTINEDKIPLADETQTADVSIDRKPEQQPRYIQIVKEPAMISSAQQSVDAPMIEEPAMILNIQQAANTTSATALIDRSRRHGAPQIPLDLGIIAADPTQSKANPRSWLQTNRELLELTIETRQYISPRGMMLNERDTGRLFDCPQAVHNERPSDSEASLPRRTPLPLSAPSSREDLHTVSMRIVGSQVSEGQAPAISVDIDRNEDYQQSTRSDEFGEYCGCSLFEILRCISCGFFQRQDPPSQYLSALSTRSVLPDQAIALSPLNRTGLSQADPLQTGPPAAVPPRAADKNGIGKPSIDGIEWRQIDWNVHSAGSRTVNASPESGTCVALDPPSPCAKVPSGKEAAFGRSCN